MISLQICFPRSRPGIQSRSEKLSTFSVEVTVTLHHHQVVTNQINVSMLRPQTVGLTLQQCSFPSQLERLRTIDVMRSGSGISIKYLNFQINETEILSERLD